MIKLPSSLTTITPFSKLLAGILFITFIVSAFFAGMNYQRAITLIAYQQSNLVTAKPSPTPDPTANWKTYVSQDYGFSIKYPENIFKDKNIILNPGDKKYLALNLGSTSDIRSGIGFVVDASENDEALEKEFQDAPNYKNDNPNEIKQEAINVDGVWGYLYYHNPEGSGGRLREIPAVYSYHIILFKGIISYYIAIWTERGEDVLKQNRALFIQILSTFKFTQ